MPINLGQLGNLFGGLAQPVVFDRFRNSSVEPGMGVTEGARPYYGGANPTGTLSADRQWKVEPDSFNTMFTERPVYSVESKLSNRGRINFDVAHNPDGTLSADVSFGGKGGLRREGSTTGSALTRLNSVMDRVEHFVKNVKPRELTWTAADDALEKFYDRALPMMAKRMGATYFTKTPRGQYVLQFEQPNSYPLPK